MRTSKISRDSARIENVLSSSRPTRRSLRQFNGPEISTTDDSSIDQAPGAEADASSDLSSPPASPSSAESDYVEEDESAQSVSRKRKRITASSTPVKSETIIKSEISSPNGTRRKASSRKPNLPKKARRQPAKHIKGENGTRAVEPPVNWEEVYAMTAEMRKKVVAPVDTMGCESLAEEHRSPVDKRLQTLVALMLSSQTKDTVTAAVMKNLQDNLPGGFNLEALLAVEPPRLNELIMSAGFHNNKTKYIKQSAEILRDKFGGDIPDTIEGMISLPGVGPKMAYLCMSAAWGRDEGIGVDVHVHRITNLWGWHKTRMPEETRKELESWLPMDKWHDINHLLVGFGQTICKPVGRRCGECTLSQGLCPSAVVQKEVKKRVKKEVLKEEKGDVKKEEHVAEDVVIKEDKADDEAPSLDAPLAGAKTEPDVEDLGRGGKRSSRRTAA